MKTQFISEKEEDLVWLAWAKNQCRAAFSVKHGQHSTMPVEGVLITYGRDASGMFVRLVDVRTQEYWFYVTLPEVLTNPLVPPTVYTDSSGVGNHNNSLGPYSSGVQIWLGQVMSQEWVTSGEVLSYLGSTVSTGVPPNPYPLNAGSYFTGQGAPLYNLTINFTDIGFAQIPNITDYYLSSATNHPTINYGATSDIPTHVLANVASASATYIHPSVARPPTTAYQTMYGDYLVSMSADSISRGYTLAGLHPSSIQTLLDGAQVGKAYTEAYVLDAETSTHAALRTTLNTALAQAIREAHPSTNIASWTPTTPTLTGDTSNGTSATITFTRDVDGEQQTKTYSCTKVITTQVVYQDHGPPANWDVPSQSYKFTLTTTTYTDWPEFVMTGGSVSVPAHGQLRLQNGVTGSFTTPNSAYDTRVIADIPEWREWRDTHKPKQKQPTTTATWYDLCIANDEELDIIPIYRVNATLDDMGMFGPAIVGSWGVQSYWIRYVFKFKWDAAAREWKHIEAREYTTQAGGRILIPPSSQTEIDGWNTKGRVIAVSHKPLLPSMKTQYENQEKFMVNPRLQVRTALEEGKYTVL